MRTPIRAALLTLVLLAALPPRAAAVPSFDRDAAWAYLEAQLEFGPRAPGTEGHAACADWMLEVLRARADRVTPHGFVWDDPYSDQRLELLNIKASFRPELDTRIAVAAHWDTRPRADRDSASVAHLPIPGANDGGSGTAVLLALADVLSENPPPIGVDLLFFDAEDWGKEGDPQYYLVGSRRFVRDFPRYRPNALVLLDLVGEKGVRIPMEGYSLRQAPQLTRLVFRRAASLGLPAFEPVPGQAVLDDHVPFLRAGIPAVNLIDFDYPYWHTLQDTLDKCSPESLEQMGTLVLHLIWLDFATGAIPRG
jgi:hypothetical protein